VVVRNDRAARVDEDARAEAENPLLLFRLLPLEGGVVLFGYELAARLDADDAGDDPLDHVAVGGELLRQDGRGLRLGVDVRGALGQHDAAAEADGEAEGGKPVARAKHVGSPAGEPNVEWSDASF
jgi:hypothetical protein